MQRRTPPKAPKWEVTFDLEQIDPTISTEELIDIASRAKVYRELITRSGLTDDGWCRAMGISVDRHKTYKYMSTKVPNSILNKAHAVQKRICALITRLSNEGI
jgi:hypothetical protein